MGLYYSVLVIRTWYDLSLREFEVSIVDINLGCVDLSDWPSSALTFSEPEFNLPSSSFLLFLILLKVVVVYNCSRMAAAASSCSTSLVSRASSGPVAIDNVEQGRKNLLLGTTARSCLLQRSYCRPRLRSFESSVLSVTRRAFANSSQGLVVRAAGDELTKHFHLNSHYDDLQLLRGEEDGFRGKMIDQTDWMNEWCSLEHFSPCYQ